MKAASLSRDAVVSFERSYTLKKNLSAIPILTSDVEQHSSIGLMTQLPEGAEIDIRGPGFSDATLKVRCGGSSYYVFRDDLEPQRKRVASVG